MFKHEKEFVSQITVIMEALDDFLLFHYSWDVYFCPEISTLYQAQ